MARLLRHARERPVDEAHDDELRRDAAVTRRHQRHHEKHKFRREIAGHLAWESPRRTRPVPDAELGHYAHALAPKTRTR